jgi:uncharacterized membrane protein
VVRDEVDDVVESERLVFFSDAVVAIAITLLAIELPLPAGETNRQFRESLAGHREEYLAFGISFAVIWNLWSDHHRFFRHVAASPALVGRNMLWLLMIVITPFATPAPGRGYEDEAAVGEGGAEPPCGPSAMSRTTVSWSAREGKPQPGS